MTPSFHKFTFISVMTLGLAGPAAKAQEYPSRNVHIVVSLAAGSGMDVVTRIYAEELSKSLGKPVVVENQPGAALMLAAQNVARAAPDGHTLVVASSPVMAVNPTLYKKVNWSSRAVPERPARQPQRLHHPSRRDRHAAQHLITKPVFDALFAATTSPRTTPSRRSCRRCSTPSTSTASTAETARLRSSTTPCASRRAGSTTPRASSGSSPSCTRSSSRPPSRSRPTSSASSTPRSRSSTSSSAPPTTLLREEFGKALTDEGVHILDPFTGTGTFMVRLLQSGLIKPDDLARKYANELHANEIMLLAYYIAAVNIETTYHASPAADDADLRARSPASSSPTPSRSPKDDDTLRPRCLPREQRPRLASNWPLSITVIVGNPPYSVGQTIRQRHNAKT